MEDGEDLSGFLYNEEDEPRIASSLIDLPTYVKNAAGLPPDVLSMLARNKETYTFIQQNFPDSLIATSIRQVQVTVIFLITRNNINWLMTSKPSLIIEFSYILNDKSNHKIALTNPKNTRDIINVV